MLFFKHPAKGTLVVGEHLPDPFVIHLLRFKFLSQKLVLLSDFFFFAHTYWSGL